MLLALLGSLGSSGCVIGRSNRPAQSESAHGPSGVAVAGGPVLPQSAPNSQHEAPSQQLPGSVWVEGYWHWDGVRYVWQRGHWQPPLP